MGKMSFERALYVLDLKSDYTSEDLKKAYRKKAMEWHPDHGKDATGERFKDIGEAYGVLGEYIDKVRPVVKSANVREFLLHKKQAIQLIKGYLENITSYVNHEFYNNMIVYNSLVYNLVNEYEVLINNCTNEFELEDLFSELNLLLENGLRQLYEDFLNIYPYVRSLNVSVDYDLKLTLFIKQIDKIKKDSLNKVKKELTNIVKTKYEAYYGYDFIKVKLDETVDNYSLQVLKSSYKEKAALIDNMNEEIAIMFEKSFDSEMRKEKMKQLLSVAKGLDSVILSQKIDELKENIDSDDFYDMVDYLIKNAKAIKNNTYLNGIQKSLIDHYSFLVKDSSPLEDEELLREALDIYTKASSLLCEVKDGILNYDILSYLYAIKFEDLEQDRKVLDFIANRAEIYNPGYVYVANKTSSLFAAVYKTNVAYQLRYKGQNDKICTKHIKDSKELEHKYVSLSLFLANAIFVGRKGRDKLGNNVLVLYSYNNLCLLLNELGEIETSYYTDITIFDREVPSLEEYRDKKLVLNKVCERVSRELPFKPVSVISRYY